MRDFVAKVANHDFGHKNRVCRAGNQYFVVLDSDEQGCRPRVILASSLGFFPG